jgi:hypothetical protein
MMRSVSLFGWLLVAAGFALAADVNGRWRAEFNLPNGSPVRHTFNFKADGEKLTGTITAERSGEAAIQEGKIDGDNLSFHVMRSNASGNEVRIDYKGKVTNNEIKFTMSFRDGRSADITAKKLP